MIMSDYNDMMILQNDSDQSVPYYDDYKDMMILQVSKRETAMM